MRRARRVQAVLERDPRRAITLRSFDRGARDALLILARGLSQFLDYLAIAVARVPIHSGIDVRWIVTQDLLHPTDTFKEDLPVLGCQSPQTGDAVGDNL